MTPIKVRRAAFQYERNDSLAPPHEAFIQGFLFAKEYYGISDDEVVSAPLCHCGSPISETPTFDTVWDIYDRKDNKQSALKAWSKLTDEERVLAYQNIPPFVLSHPDKVYRPMLSTYLNQKRFNDEEIITHAQPANQTQQRFASYTQAINDIGREG